MRLSDKEVFERFEAAVKAAGSARKFAEKAKVSPTMICLVLSGDTKVSEKLAAYIGVKKIPAYWDDGR